MKRRKVFQTCRTRRKLSLKSALNFMSKYVLQTRIYKVTEDSVFLTA